MAFRRCFQIRVGLCRPRAGKATTGQRHAQYPLLVLVCNLVAASVAAAHEGDAPPVKIGGAIGVNLFYGDFDDARSEGVGVAGFDLSA